MVELYGLRTDWYQIMNRLGSEADYVRDLLATFDTEREAQAYVKASELVNNSGGYPTYNIYRKQFRYRKDSLFYCMSRKPTGSSCGMNAIQFKIF